MTKSELIKALANKYSHLEYKDVEFAVKVILEHKIQALMSGERIEIRGFGSFSMNYRPARIGRNPNTGESVTVAPKCVPHFKPGKDLRERVNKSRAANSKMHRPISDREPPKTELKFI